MRKFVFAIISSTGLLSMCPGVASATDITGYYSGFVSSGDVFNQGQTYDFSGAAASGVVVFDTSLSYEQIGYATFLSASEDPTGTLVIADPVVREILLGAFGGDPSTISFDPTGVNPAVYFSLIYDDPHGSYENLTLTPLVGSFIDNGDPSTFHVAPVDVTASSLSISIGSGGEGTLANVTFTDFSFTPPTALPEPSGLLSLGLPLLVLGAVAARRWVTGRFGRERR